ncbi:MAG: glycoside hydrolase family 5 protein [Chloroflexales bacterium]|nr:glycoside hydrolase family 5 protein [Chloroflexales bacterium]
MWPIQHRVALMLLLTLAVIPLLAPPDAHSQGAQKTYLPMVARMSEPSIYGFEAGGGSMGGNVRVGEQARQLGARWSRMNIISWREVQPNPDRNYNWGALATFERDLAVNVALKLEPVVIIDDSPAWATIKPSSCAAIKDEYHAEFAAFMQALVNRYKDRVSYWELGNEPDVDPSLVATDNVFGCWGDISDPYYGGERYGRMLRAVAPAIRRADPGARIVIGGLLLATPNTTDPGMGHPEAFLDGILRAGAGGSFDILAYHAYPSYPNQQIDYDLEAGNGWRDYGGWTVGKARYLRGVMQRYGLNKPLWLDETGLLCTPPYAECTSPTSAFFQAQADHIVRIASRAAAAGVQQVSWYTLDGPGWRSSALLDENQQPRPVYTTYQHLIRRLGQYFGVAATTYSAETEAYRYNKGSTVVDVVWSRSSAVRTIEVPIGRFLAAYSRDGLPLTPRLGATAQIDVGFSPVFIERVP